MAKILCILHLPPYQRAGYFMYVLLHSVLTCGNNPIYKYLGYWLRAFVWLISFVWFCHTPVLSCILHNCAVFNLNFGSDYCSISCYLHLLKASHSVIQEVFNIILRPNTIWPGMDYNVAWYMRQTAKYVAARIPDQGSLSSRQLICEPNVSTRFAMTRWILLILNLIRYLMYFHTSILSRIYFRLSCFKLFTKEFIPTVIHNYCRPCVST